MVRSSLSEGSLTGPSTSGRVYWGQQRSASSMTSSYSASLVGSIRTRVSMGPRRSQIESAGDRHAGAVGQVPVRRRLQHREVGLRAHPEVPDVVAPQRQRAAGGRRPQRLAPGTSPSPGRRARRPAAWTTCSRCRGCSRSPARPRRRRRAARGHPGRASGWRTRRRAAGWRRCPLARTSARRRPARRRPRAQVRAVVDARRAELDGELDAGPGRELVAVHPGQQAGRDPGRQHAARLVTVEGVLAGRLAEHVDPAGVRRAGLEHRGR